MLRKIATLLVGGGLLIAACGSTSSFTTESVEESTTQVEATEATQATVVETTQPEVTTTVKKTTTTQVVVEPTTTTSPRTTTTRVQSRIRTGTIREFSITVRDVREVNGQLRMSISIRNNGNDLSPDISSGLFFYVEDSSVRHDRKYLVLQGDPFSKRVVAGGMLAGEAIFDVRYSRGLKLVVDLSAGFWIDETIYLSLPNPETTSLPSTTVTTSPSTTTTTDDRRVVYEETIVEGEALWECDYADNRADRESVKRTQRQIGVVDDGSWGPATQAAYDIECPGHTPTTTTTRPVSTTQVGLTPSDIRGLNCSSWTRSMRQVVIDAGKDFNWGRRDHNNDGYPCESQLGGGYAAW